MTQDFTDLPPVPPVEKPPAFRQTLMRQFDSCLRSGYLALKHPDVPSHAKDRGTALHIVAQKMMQDWMEMGETYTGWVARPNPTGTYPSQVSEMSGALVDEVLDGSPGLQLSHSDSDAVRAMAYHLAVGTDVEPGSVLGLEREFSHEVGGEVVTATVDRLYELEPGVLGIDDFKSQFGIPTQDEFENGMLAFQLRFYAWIATASELGSYERVYCRTLFPRYLREDGLVQYRELWLDKQRLQEFGRDLERLMRRVLAGFQERHEDPQGFPDWQKWPAVPGDHCSYCPMQAECPIPSSYRRWAGFVDSEEKAVEALLWSERVKDLTGATQREVRKYIEQHGPLDAGSFIYDLNVTESQGLRKVKGRSDWDGMAEAVANGTFVREEWVKPTTTTRLRRLKREVWFREHATGFEGEDCNR